MAQIIPTITRRSAVAGLALTAAPVALLAGTDRVDAQAKPAAPEAKQTKPEKSLYERLGGVFAIAAVVDHFSDAVVKNPIVGKSPRTRSCRNGTPRIWEGCPASSSCGRCGSATSLAGPTSSRPPSRARLRSALRRLTGT